MINDQTLPRLGLLIVAVFYGSCLADELDEGFVKLFDGHQMAGWEGDPETWTVRDGAITCTGRSGNKNWLIWRDGEIGDFELRLRFKFLLGNSGVQVRSEEISKWQIRGYQVEIAERKKMGLWHHSLRPAEYRRYLSQAGQKVLIRPSGEMQVDQLAEPEEVQEVYRESDWNDLTVIALGPRLVQSINGVVFTELIDNDEKYSARRGILALQDHGKGTVVQYKDILLKRFE